MEFTLSSGAVLLLVILILIAKPNFFNFGKVTNNYYSTEPEQIPEKEKKKLKDVSDK